MSDLRNGIHDLLNELKGMEERARGLKNQNLADIIASARGKIKQLSDHPDLELLEDRKDQEHLGNPVYAPPATKEEAIARLQAQGHTAPMAAESVARETWPHLFDASPGAAAAGPPFPPAPSVSA